MIKDELKKAISIAIADNTDEEIEPKITEPEYKENGDWTTNVSFIVAKKSGKDATEVAEKISSYLRQSHTDLVERVEIKNGFINIWVKNSKVIEELEKKIDFEKKKENINIEFVSANPTGPLTMANGRGGFYGDVLANVLKKTGYEVTREYYINDAGFQIAKLGESIFKLKDFIPFNIVFEYQAQYAKDLSNKIEINKEDEIILKKLVNIAENRFLAFEKAQPADRYVAKDLIYGMRMLLDDPKIKKQYDELCNKYGLLACSELVKSIKISLENVGVVFDKWFSEEKDLRNQGKLEEFINFLKKKDLVADPAFPTDNAIRLKLSRPVSPQRKKILLNRVPSLLPDEDIVLIKGDGEPTYFFSDLAYHYNKFFERNFDIGIDILGADHHGYKKQLEQSMEMFGITRERLNIIIMQLVRLVSGGKEIKMSKRLGTFVTLDELIKQVGLDVARWFFLERSPNTHMDFDLDLAKEKSEKNPVYYVQYAYVRMRGILRNSKSQETNSRLEKLESESERDLALKILRYPEILEEVSKDYQVQKLTTYAYELAQTFSAFYRDVKVVGSPREGELLYLVSKTKETFGDVLSVMGISRPEKM